ncbi:MAG TPA: ABC transporter permease [Candidatus Methylomirabilis sp.]|nr:ABC transporter permease [Candidatus Methylomirabilis sp.]
MKNFYSLTRMRIQLTVRNKMFIFFTLVMPFAFFFLYAGVFAKGVPRVVAYFLGPILSLTVMGSFWGLSAALVTFREQGILRRFHVTPVSAADMLASSIIANFVLVLPTVILQFLFARFIFHVTQFGNLFSVFLLIFFGTISFASMGLVVASVTNTMQETQVINQLIWLPLIFLSGATFPLAFLPDVAKKFAVFLPATYLVQGLQAAIVSSTKPLDLLVQMGSLAFWTVLTFFLAVQLFRWEPEVKTHRRAKLLVAATAVPFLLLGIWENHVGTIPASAQTMYDALSGPHQSGNQESPPK